MVKGLLYTKKPNKAKIVGVKFYIRGKPWAVTVDEKMLFMYPENPRMKFA